jgi:hypothetical protein
MVGPKRSGHSFRSRSKHTAVYFIIRLNDSELLHIIRLLKFRATEYDHHRTADFAVAASRIMAETDKVGVDGNTVRSRVMTMKQIIQ